MSGPIAVRVVIETVSREAACPDCGTVSARVKDRPLRRVKDLPVCGQRVELWWRKRRLVCLPEACPRRSFLERTAALPPRSRLTMRLREHLAAAIAGSNRAVSEVAAEHGVAWHTAHRALVAAAVRWLPEPTPAAVLGIDETRARSVRWLKESTGCDPAWVHRRMLLAAGDRLSARQLRRLERVLAADDPTNEIGAAWGVKELLRQLLAARDPADIRARLWAFNSARATANMPDTTRLAATSETWWPHVLVLLQLGVTNARTAGFGRQRDGRPAKN